MAEFFAMGGYAAFVWSSFGIAFVALLLTFIYPMIQRRNIINEIKKSQERKEKLARRVQ